jgi:replication factor C small subunit
MNSESYSNALSDALTGQEPTYPTPYEVDELTHAVRSSWEEDVAKLLVENDITYVYEPEFELETCSYYPDVVVNTVVIEVKGFANERSIEKATTFMNEYPDCLYVVIGDKMPCDRYIPWEERAAVLEVIADD